MLRPFVSGERRLRQIDRMADCGSYLDFVECSVDSSHDSRLKHANFCKSRFCPMCQWRRGLKYSHDAYGRLSKVLMDNPSYGIVHLTLTIRNLSVYTVLDHKRFMENFYKLRRGKLFKRCIGGLWAVEVTDRGKGYHPHIHALCVVPRNEKGLPVLAAQADLSLEWLRLTGDSFVIGVRSVYDNFSEGVYEPFSGTSDNSALEHAVVEVCKYPFGGLEVSDPRRLAALMDVFDFQRMVGTWGCLFGLKVEDSDLVHVEEEPAVPVCKVCGGELCDVSYIWSGAHYERHVKAMASVKIF